MENPDRGKGPAAKKPVFPLLAAAGLLVFLALVILLSCLRTARSYPSPDSPAAGSASPGPGSSAGGDGTEPAGTTAAGTTGIPSASSGISAARPTEGLSSAASSAPPSAGRTTGRTTASRTAAERTTERTTEPPAETTAARPPVTEEIRQAVLRQVREKYAAAFASREAEHRDTVEAIEAGRQEIAVQRGEKVQEVNRLYAAAGEWGSEKHQKALQEAMAYRQEDYERLNREEAEEERAYILWQEDMERTIAEEAEKILQESCAP
ncbi:MAG TPA: hypothetical protein H9684_09155 [Firmicutes bacterium]|nr:hypothetical protein [Bacillota bacterium]